MPSGGALKGKGRGLLWLKAHIWHAGQECLIWPFCTNHQGYGQLGYFGKVVKAHRLMCILAHGEPLTPQHQAAHSCGQGHTGCVHPEHVSWKTPRENRIESNEHGTGHGRLGRKELSPDIVLKIRYSPKSYLDIADEFGVYFGTVGKIKRRELYPNLS